MIPLEQMQQSGFRNDRYIWPFICYNEIWVRVSTFLPNAQDRYWVSNLGRVYDSVWGCCLNPIPMGNGYLSVTMYAKEYDTHNKHTFLINLHRLVCMAFHGLPGPGMVANHKNSCRIWNSEENLEWITHKENVQYSFAHGNRGVGENSNRSIFTEAQVRAVCELLQQGIVDARTIAARVFNREPDQQIKTLLYNIRSGQFWTSVSKDYIIPPSKPHKVHSDEDAHKICKYFQDHPDLVGKKGTSAKVAMDVFGINTSGCKRGTPENALVAYINGIGNHKLRTDISSQYNF